MVSAGYMLRKLRKGKGLTGEEVAGSIGISKKSLYNIENAEHSPSLPILKRLVEFYGIEYNSIFNEINYDGDLNVELGNLLNKYGSFTIDLTGVNPEKLNHRSKTALLRALKGVDSGKGACPQKWDYTSRKSFLNLMGAILDD